MSKNHWSELLRLICILLIGIGVLVRVLWRWRTDVDQPGEKGWYIQVPVKFSGTRKQNK